MSEITLTALHPSGFEVCLKVPSLEHLEAAIADLVQRGYRPPRGDSWQRSPTGEPICPKHQVVMRLRQKQHEEWWSHRVVDRQTGAEVYCKGYQSPSSPGWEISS